MISVVFHIFLPYKHEMYLTVPLTAVLIWSSSVHYHNNANVCCI